MPKGFSAGKHRITPGLETHLAAACHLNRPIAELIRSRRPFENVELELDNLRIWKVVARALPPTI